MPKSKVLHRQRVIGRVFRAATAAKYPVETIEFTADGNIIVRPVKPHYRDEAADRTKNEWDRNYGPPSAA